ncbi:fumarylacetoacetate hydrolase family protein [Sphingomonas sp. MMSM20]|uniref:fumarylacetoacetate hydrolase family protein n=1 Tax=Sphingomonas lycopersici TaxID=2951807 RepID=UPI002237D3D7|nr:fumarylacetoacetate hydrolase family protein [Sphingomonas lycopersici]MCW6530771.1 fumarylacetoacetate hydrolase family protein [Sphingomonas lycopersici]
MASMIIRYDVGEGAQWAVLTGDAPVQPDETVAVRDLDTVAVTLGDLIGELDADRALPGWAATIPARAILSPVTTDATLVCQGLNYHGHAAESGHQVRKANLLFGKASSTLCGPYDDIVRPAGVDLLDYEAEIGIVLRRALHAGAMVDRGTIGSYVAGVVLCNDVSARDAMFAASFLQWYRGKSYRTFCPAGPVFYYLRESEVADTIANLALSLRRGTELRQAANSGQLIYPPAETLAELASFQDLKRGDMLLTGTPGGVIAQNSPAVADVMRTHLFDDARRRDELRAALDAPRFLQPGETLSLTLHDIRAGKHLGGQRSVIVEEAADVY